MTERGYYLSSLLAWKADLQKQLRQSMARYARMEIMAHPDKQDQGKLIDITRAFIQRLDAEMKDLESE